MNDSKQKPPIDPEQRRLARMSRRGFAIAGAALAAAVGGIRFAARAELEDDLPWPLRRILQGNERLWRAAFRRDRLAETYPDTLAREPRVNGREGLPPQLDATPSEAERAEWRIEVTSPSGRAELSLARLGELPRVEMTAQLRCIEGWSTIVHWGGVRLLDALAATRIATRSGRGPDPDSAPDDLFQFVGLATPDGGYHVGLDVESALHPQTLLVDTMNGRPLTVGHGGPIRLVIPVKYGVKNIKRVGSIALSDTRPSDYWAQRGYDWYAGL